MIRLLLPREGTALPDSGDLTLTWVPVRQMARDRVEIGAVAGGRIFTAFVAAGGGRYLLPPSARERIAAVGEVRWRVVSLDAGGRVRATSVWRRLGTKLSTNVRPSGPA